MFGNPDIVVVHVSKKEIKIIDVFIPGDAYVDGKMLEKSEKKTTLQECEQ